MKLHDYQYKGSQFWIDVQRAYFAVDMGMGKTVMALHALTKLKRPALIIAPLRPVYTTWSEEIKKWNIPLSYSIVHGKNKETAIRQNVDLYITNFQSIPFIYNYLVSLTKKRKPFPFEICVIDEGSMIKSNKTQRFKYLDALRRAFPKYRLILSGTPAPNSLLDLWAQYYFLTDGEALGSIYGTFRRLHYDAEEYNAFTYTLKPGADKVIYEKIAPYTYRLDEADYLTLPKIIYNYISVDLPNKYKKMYREFKRDFLLTINDVDHIALNAATLSLKLRQFLQGFIYYQKDEIDKNGMPLRGATVLHTLKIQALKNLIDETGQPMLCAIQFKQELEMLLQAFPGTPVIAGGVNSATATDLIRKWNKKELPLLICHPASISHGVNLQSGGCNIVWLCQTWSLEQYQQFNKRLHRQGQTQGVIIHHIVIKGTIDDKVSKTLAHKNLTQQALLDFLRDSTNYE